MIGPGQLGPLSHGLTPTDHGTKSALLPITSDPLSASDRGEIFPFALVFLDPPQHSTQSLDHDILLSRHRGHVKRTQLSSFLFCFGACLLDTF